MSERPYYLIGARQLQLLSEHLEPALTSLALRWWNKPLMITIRRLDDIGAAACPPVRHVVGANGQYLATLGDQKTWINIAQQWLHCSVERTGAMAEWLEKKYIAELYQAIFGRSITDSSAETAFGVDERPGAGQLVLTIQIADTAQMLLLSPSILRRLPSKKTEIKPSALTQAAGALTHTQVNFEARLRSVQLPLTELVHLAPGDFLSLQDDLSGALTLVGRDIELTLLARLGKKNDHKAALITAITEPS